MQQKWFLTSDESNYRINHEFLKTNIISNSYNPEKHIVCFSHVPKTAGTSIESIMIKNFKASESLHVNAPDLNRQTEILQLKKNPPRLISGHHPIHGMLYQLLPESPIFHFTMLREPVDRVLSYFNYIKGKDDHSLHQFTHNKTLTEFLQTNSSPELSNGQAKRFSGNLHNGVPEQAEMFELARNTLDQCFSLVLTTCLFDEGLLLLKNRLALNDIYYKRDNVSTKYIQRAELSDSELNLILAMNQVDSELFTWAQAACQKVIHQELTDQEIKVFKDNNQRWAELVQA